MHWWALVGYSQRLECSVTGKSPIIPQPTLRVYVTTFNSRSIKCKLHFYVHYVDATNLSEIPPQLFAEVSRSGKSARTPDTDCRDPVKICWIGNGAEGSVSLCLGGYNLEIKAGSNAIPSINVS